MAPAGKDSGFHKQGNDWFYKAGLPSDIMISVDGVNFHLHRFPLISKCGKMARIHEESKNVKSLTTTLEEFPGGPEAFLIAAKFCYGVRIEFTPKNIVMVYCAADYLEMTEELGEGNLVSKAESFFYKAVLHNWKDCILTLQSSEALVERADKLRIVDRCLNALSVMVCTDPSLFGWPMMMYGSLQSPGGSILWNGINTGARIRSSESDWWFEDISYLGIVSFQRLIKAMESKGIRPENIVGAIMYYARKYLPGLGRWQSSGVIARTVTSFSLKPAALDQRVVLESIEKLLPQRKGKSFCRFLLGLLRVGIILGVEKPCLDSLEKRIGTQMEMATLDGLLIPSYSDSDTLYDTDTVQRIVRHFVSSAESRVESFSPASAGIEASPSSSSPMRKVAKLVDSYIAEVASDVNLKPAKVRSLAEAVPGSARALQDGLYRGLDIYLKAHPWLSEREKEELCNVIEFERLSIDACAHASQNDRLPLRIVLQVLFFEQMHLRTALTGCLNVLDADDAAAPPPAGPTAAKEGTVGWVSVARENRALKGDMARMRSRVGELEEEFGKIKDEMKKVTKSQSSIAASPRFAIARRMGCKLLHPRPSEPEIVTTTPRASSVEQPPRASGSSKHHRKSFSLF